MPDRFTNALAAIDAANALDPDNKELLYSQRMTEWLHKLSPAASEPLRLAARAQHIRRWEIPRSRFPMDRIGYHRWRTALYQFHADRATEILHSVGYDPATVSRVSSLLKKEKLNLDPDAQLLEDVICLVFLQYEFADFLQKHPDDKLINILKKTWKKMSPPGHSAALALLPTLPHAAQSLLHRALD